MVCKYREDPKVQHQKRGDDHNWNFSQVEVLEHRSQRTVATGRTASAAHRRLRPAVQASAIQIHVNSGIDIQSNVHVGIQITINQYSNMPISSTVTGKLT